MMFVNNSRKVPLGKRERGLFGIKTGKKDKKAAKHGGFAKYYVTHSTMQMSDLWAKLYDFPVKIPV